MSIPRVMSLRSRPDGGVDLLQEPIPALASMSHRATEPIMTAATLNVTAGGAAVVANGCDGAFLLDVTVSLVDGATAASVLVRAAADGSAGTGIVWNSEKGELAVDRRKSGRVDFSEDFSGVHAAPMPYATLADGKLRLLVLVDEGSVEVFADGGRVAITDIVFPDKEHKAVVLRAEGARGSVVFADVRVVPLRPYREGCAAHENSCRLAL